MSSPDCVIGIIAIDPAPDRVSLDDATLGDTLRRLQSHPAAESCQYRRWHDVDCHDRHTLLADLAQLAADLQAEYHRLVATAPVAVFESP